MKPTEGPSNGHHHDKDEKKTEKEEEATTSEGNYSNSYLFYFNLRERYDDVTLTDDLKFFRLVFTSEKLERVS